jgi:hypothetical protein
VGVRRSRVELGRQDGPLKLHVERRWSRPRRSPIFDDADRERLPTLLRPWTWPGIKATLRRRIERATRVD